MDTASKFWQDEKTLWEMTRHALQRPVQRFSARALDGGFFNAVYRVQADDAALVVKIAPQKQADLLFHERDLLRNEAQMLSLVNRMADIPAPQMICYDESRTLCAAPYLFMSAIPGESFEKVSAQMSPQERGEVKAEMGRITARLNAISGAQFGLPQIPTTLRDTNGAFMLNFFQSLFRDGQAKGLDLQEITYDALWELIWVNCAFFDEAETPCLLHTDLWDDNVMVQGGRLSGVIDFERAAWGDPMMEDDFSGYGSRPVAFLRGYGKTAFTRGEEIRISLYKLWRRVMMLTECPYRKFADDSRYN
ncbi:MAG: aminoglycoside phosphotransferase family protein [Eubacteriales bacterium]|nr:aminoglycoside phosphotransferase family protein [Eubacteriales bacterium]